jgi:hypothetical protein
VSNAREPRSRGRATAIATLVTLIVGGALGLSTQPPADAASVYTGLSIRQHSTNAVTDASSDADAYPTVRLVSPMAPWRALEPQDQSFDWTRMDANVEHARINGYRLLVRIMAGRMTPSWLPSAGVETIRVLGTDANAPDYCNWIDVPVPWGAALEAEYRQLMRAVGGWLEQPDGAGGTKGDHVSLIPVAMPTILGTEMQIGFGAGVTCPAGTDGAGQSLATTNRTRWTALGTVEQLQQWTEGAWRRAIEIHMQELPGTTRSVIAWGGLFGDGHAAALRIARSEIAPNRDRLWSMYTNLQPKVTSGLPLEPWKEWCAACHEVVMAAIAGGGMVGFQAATTRNTDSKAEMRFAVNDALSRYGMKYLEINRAILDSQPEYFLTGAHPVQSRVEANADKRPTITSAACTDAAEGESTTCRATVREVYGGGAAAGVVVAWDGQGTFGAATCVTDTDGTCDVSFMPSAGTGLKRVAVSAGEDATHLISEGVATATVTAKRATTTSATCSSPVTVGAASSCEVTVSDADGGQTPTGNVTWSSGSPGTWSSTSCALAGTAGSATCAASYVPSTTGTHAISASYGGSAIHATSASSAAVQATAPVDAAAPTVRITSPSNGASVPKGKTVTIAAEATDNVGVAKVEFSVSGVLRCTDTTAPYTCAWAVPKTAGVTYALTARAFDAAGNTATHSITVRSR